MASSDYEVFADSDYTKKWLVIDKQGSFWKDKCHFVVENYVREPEDTGIGSGECLAKCELDQLSSDNYKYYDYSWDEEHYFEDSDDSDGYSDSGDDDDYAGSKIKQKCKFKCDTKATFYSDR